MHKIPDSYSADVRLHLIVGDQRLNVAQVGPEECILRQTIVVAPSEAELEISIDGNIKKTRVFLTQGISPDSPVVPFRRLTV